MRPPYAALALALLFPAAAAAQSAPPPETAPAAAAGPAATISASSADACTPAEANLGGIGRAHVVAFTGAVFGARVCALSAGLPFDAFDARFADAASASDAVVVAALGSGTGAEIAARDGNLRLLSPLPRQDVAASAAAPAPEVSPQPGGPAPAVAAAPPPAGAAVPPPVVSGPNLATVGPYVVAPGGVIPDFNGDTSELPRVVLGYAGQRVFVIATSPVELVDLARALRDQPDLFGADEAFERAIVLASGPSASLTLRTSAGEMRGGGTAPPARVLVLSKR
ncbi:MAG TPA: hypothetical protein VFB22_16715 [Candidatus Baltobacteraceae bacterium]|nr:hypothetical protein [Candidatus Baltobacteraceae bacterium]